MNTTLHFCSQECLWPISHRVNFVKQEKNDGCDAGYIACSLVTLLSEYSIYVCSVEFPSSMSSRSIFAHSSFSFHCYPLLTKLWHKVIATCGTGVWVICTYTCTPECAGFSQALSFSHSFSNSGVLPLQISFPSSVWTTRRLPFPPSCKTCSVWGFLFILSFNEKKRLVYIHIYT